MAERLAPWVWVGAGVLAGVAGIINVVGFLGFEHQAITHLTGTTTLLGAAVVRADARAMLHLGGILAAFVAGAVLSGMIIQDSTLRLGKPYGVVLGIEAVLLAASVPLFGDGHIGGALLAAMACGLQNAMATTYSGALIRTSHLSGMFTDLGLTIGHALRGLPVAQRRLLLCVLIIGCFFLGGLLGAWMFGRIGYATLYLPAVLTGGSGLAYYLYRHFRVGAVL